MNGAIKCTYYKLKDIFHFVLVVMQTNIFSSQGFHSTLFSCTCICMGAYSYMYNRRYKSPVLYIKDLVFSVSSFIPTLTTLPLDPTIASSDFGTSSTATVCASSQDTRSDICPVLSSLITKNRINLPVL